MGQDLLLVWWVYTRKSASLNQLALCLVSQRCSTQVPGMSPAECFSCMWVRVSYRGEDWGSPKGEIPLFPQLPPTSKDPHHLAY